MESIEGDCENLKRVLPKQEYQSIPAELLGDLVRTLNPEELKTASGDIFGRIYEYFLTLFADQAVHDCGFYDIMCRSNLCSHQRIGAEVSSSMFSNNPTPQEFFGLRIFADPLVPIGATPTPAQNDALARALLDFTRRKLSDDCASLTDLLNAHPASPWNASLLTNLGLEYYNAGQY